MGVGGLESAALSVGSAAKTVMQSIYSPAISDVALGSSGLLASAGSYAYNDYISSDAATVASSQNAYDSLLPNGFNAVNGTVSVSNSQGTILSALTGVSLADNTSNNNVWSVADINGTYSLLFPPSSTNFNYSNDAFTFAAIDPYTHASISTSAMNLSGAMPGTPLNGPNISGVCTDLDASSPDADDPDCD